MSSRTLGLEKLHLTLNSEKLTLEIASKVDIKFPSGWFSSLDDDGVFQALTSGYIWAPRGRRCRVDVDISFNEKPLDAVSRIHILESLGYHLRDANVSLSACLWMHLLISY